MTEYRLTASGHDLQRVIERLGAWAARWAFGEPAPDELDPVLLLWRMHRRIHVHLLPPTRTVVEFDFSGRGGRRLWLVLAPREVSVCLKPPGFDSDLVVHADLSFFYRIWVGGVDYDTAVRTGAILVEGPRRLVRELPRWFMWSPMAKHVRAERERNTVIDLAQSMTARGRPQSRRAGTSPTLA